MLMVLYDDICQNMLAVMLNKSMHDAFNESHDLTHFGYKAGGAATAMAATMTVTAINQDDEKTEEIQQQAPPAVSVPKKKLDFSYFDGATNFNHMKP